MRKSIDITTAQTKIVAVTKQATQNLPFEHEAAVHSYTSSIEQFLYGRTDSMFLEFGISFHVTASLSVTKKIGEKTYEVRVSQSSGMRTLSQQQASHNLMGDVLKAAHKIQAVIDELPEII